MSLKLSYQQESLLRLIKRSKCEDDGWYLVSAMIWRVVDGVLPSDLVETKLSDNGGGHLRLTERGKAIADYV